MKAHLLWIFILSMTISLYAQNDFKPKEDKTYEFRFGTELTPCDVKGDPIHGASIQVAEKGWQVKIDKVLRKKGIVVLYFLKWKETNVDLKSRNSSLVFSNASAVSKRKYYSLPILYFNESLKITESIFSFEFGTVTIPIKIRPGNGDNIPLDFYGNFNAGVGLNLKIKDFVGVYGGISITTVPVDKETTNGLITTPTNAAALTPTIGLIKEVAGVQIGAFIGFDFLSRELGENWIYQGRRWFGIGVGVNLFDVSSGKTSSDPQ